MSLPSFAVIIPARYASTRYPGKPLVALAGANGERKTLIQRSWECASSIAGSVGVWVATDDDRIADAVRSFGGQVVMTSPACANGTERCADALQSLGDVAEVIVNLQGDAPLSPNFVAERLVERLADDEQAMVATPAVRCSASTLTHLLEDAAQGRVGGTTVVFSRMGRALYFSKRILPYLPSSPGPDACPVYLHLGMYAYRPSALHAYAQSAASDLEVAEGLEQLRFFDIDLPLAAVTIDHLDWDPIELNNPSDVEAIERTLKKLELR